MSSALSSTFLDTYVKNASHAATHADLPLLLPSPSSVLAFPSACRSCSSDSPAKTYPLLMFGLPVCNSQPFPCRFSQREAPHSPSCSIPAHHMAISDPNITAKGSTISLPAPTISYSAGSRPNNVSFMCYKISSTSSSVKWTLQTSLLNYLGSLSPMSFSMKK